MPSLPFLLLSALHQGWVYAGLSFCIPGQAGGLQRNMSGHHQPRTAKGNNISPVSVIRTWPHAWLGKQAPTIGCSIFFDG